MNAIYKTVFKASPSVQNVTGLPSGISLDYTNNIATISGTTSETGVFSYYAEIKGNTYFYVMEGTITVQ